MRARHRHVLGVVVLAAVSVGWLDRHAREREGNALYDAGKYDEAAARYNEALIDQPDSPVLHFNLGDAAYRQERWDDAVAAFAQVTDPGLAAAVAYNVGNTRFRQGEALVQSEPQAALGRWTEALVAYRRAITTDPTDLDAKFNYELVLKRIEELQSELEEEAEQQEEDAQDEQPPDQPQDEQSQREPPGEDGSESAPEEPNQTPATPPEPEPGAPEEQTAGEDASGEEMSPDEAAALLDAQGREEVSPEEITQRLQGAGVVEPAQDW